MRSMTMTRRKGATVSDKVANGLVVENFCRCTLCGASADKYNSSIQCQSRPGHISDCYTGIFSDLTHPSENAEKKGTK